MLKKMLYVDKYHYVLTIFYCTVFLTLLYEEKVCIRSF